MYTIMSAAGMSVGRLAAPSDREVLTLLVLRGVEDYGPLTGLEALNRVAGATDTLRLTPAGYPLLHELAEAGSLEIEPGRPPRYRITAGGRREAERLARTWWSSLSTEMDRFNGPLSPALPRAEEDQFSSEWAGEPGEGSIWPPRS